MDNAKKDNVVEMEDQGLERVSDEKDIQSEEFKILTPREAGITLLNTTVATTAVIGGITIGYFVVDSAADGLRYLGSKIRNKEEPEELEHFEDYC